MRSAARLLPLAALLLFVAGLCLHPMAESDLFFHLQTGREILLRHRLLDRNFFSFTAPDFPNLDTSWLFEVGAAALYARGGFPALVLAKTAVVVAAFGGAYRICRRRGAGEAASALALAAAAFVGRDRFVERPHVFSLAGIVATLAVIDALGALDRPATRARATVALYLAAVVVWANLHAGVFVAPILIGAAALAAAATRDRPGAGRLAALALASALAALVTPVGTGLVRYLRLHLTLPALHPVDEFRAPTWLSDAPLVVYAAVAGGAAAFLIGVADPAGRRRALRFLAPVLPVAALAAHAIRFGADAALVAAPLLALAGTAARRWLAPRLARAPGPLPARFADAAAGLLLLGLTVALRLGSEAPRGLGLDTRELPLAAIAFADANGLRDRMYNDFELGAYLLFEPDSGPARHRVFVDPRLPAYPPELHRLLGRADLTRVEWQEAMDHYGVTSALLGYAGINRRSAWWDPERWALVWSGGDARVFVRRLPRFRALIAAREIPATFGFTTEEGTATLPLETRPAASPVAEAEWQRRLGDLLFELDGALSARARAAYARALAAPRGSLASTDEARLGAWLGAVELSSAHPADALALLERALGAGDRELSTFTDRAAALEALGRRADAAAAWREVAQRAGDSALAVRARARAARLQN
ncbi:MAG TPA: hypothetical protein VKZ18_24530 [Polyangia bacterium]|nr:hypothetical protein [Polyangia bacterium]